MIKNNYHKHLLIGVVIGILTSMLLHLFSYDNLSINLVCGFFSGVFAGTIWEGEQTYKYQNNWDWFDVMWSGVGSFVGSLIITLILP